MDLSLLSARLQIYKEPYLKTAKIVDRAGFEPATFRVSSTLKGVCEADILPLNYRPGCFLGAQRYGRHPGFKRSVRPS